MRRLKMSRPSWTSGAVRTGTGPEVDLLIVGKESGRETVGGAFACADAHLGDGSRLVPCDGADERQCDLPQSSLVAGRSRVVLSLLAGLGQSLLRDFSETGTCRWPRDIPVGRK